MANFCTAWYEDLISSGLNVLDKCPICSSFGLDRYVGSHSHKATEQPSSEPISDPININEFEIAAKSRMSKSTHGYYASGANDMLTLSENKEAFKRIKLLPRMLVDVSRISTEVTVLGTPLSSPICIAPSALQKMAHPEGELAVSRAAGRRRALVTLSTMSTTSLEDVAGAATGAPRWFQLYVHKNRTVTEALVRRAEAAGYLALVVTVDAPVLGRREPDIRNNFSVPDHLTLGNFSGRFNADGTEAAAEGSPIDGEACSPSPSSTAFSKFFAGLIDASLTWEDIDWLRSFTSLKIVLKGILTPADALLSLEHGADAIWVSNHGARQLDSVPASIEVLEPICAAVAGRCEVYLDGGVTRGTDVFKALALGATAVFLGRPALWGLAVNGEEGVHRVMELLDQELALAMQLAGTSKISEISRSYVAWAHELFEKR